jgi:hypothetical protein
MENRNGGGAQDHHRDRQSEIKLHEAHAIGVALAGGGDEGDGAGLRRHDGEAHGVPWHRFASQEIFVHGGAAAAAVQSVADDEREPREHYHPIEWPHEAKTLVKT